MTTGSLADTTVGVAYRHSLSAAGGTPPYAWRVSNGALPPGLALSQGGVISGTPTTVGTATFVVQVADQASNAAFARLSLTVLQATSSTTASVRPSSVLSGARVVYSATVATDGPTATGSVSFTTSNGSTALCSATLAGGAASCTASNAPVGNDLVSAAYSGSPTVAPSSATTLVSVALPPYLWPEFQHDPTLNGASGDPSVSTSSAPQLGIRWMTNTGGPVLASPVVAWSSARQASLVVTENSDGVVAAYSQATGLPVWSDQLGGSFRGTPLVEGNAVWVGSSASGRVDKLSLATGALVCSAPVANAPGEAVGFAPVLGAPPGGRPTIYVGAGGAGGSSGPLVAVNESDCGVDFSVTPEPTAGTGGIAGPVSYAVDASGEPLIVFGTTAPDAAVYAVDAVTGNAVWRVAVADPAPGGFGVDGITIATPGTNNFSDGVAYITTKFGFVDALDLTTGAVIWQIFASGYAAGSPPSLSGSALVFGDQTGMDALNATSGASIWHFADAAGVQSAPALAGPAGAQVAAFFDLGAQFVAVSVGDGSLLYRYQTGAFSMSSVADANGDLVGASADGYLYDFRVSGDNAPPATTVVATPANGTTIANPNGSLTITGTAAGPTPVGGVTVAIEENGPAGPWWNGAQGVWTAAPYPNPATLSAPGTTSTGWSLQLPVSPGGATLEILASAVNQAGNADRSAQEAAPSAARALVNVNASSNGPQVSVSSPFAGPGGALNVSAQGFAAGENVQLSIANTPIATVVASSAGGVTNSSITVPSGIPFGPDALVASGLQSGLVTSAPLYVSNAYAELGLNALHGFNEGDDPAFNQRPSVSAGGFLTPAWTFHASGAVNGSVVVAKATAYAADHLGNVYALNISAGTPLWHYNDGGSPIDGTPALSNGTVIVASAAGTVTALSQSAGAVVWSTQIGSGAGPRIAAGSSPSVSGSTVYVTTSSGSLVALRLTTGQVLWTAPLPGTSSSSAAVDPSQGLVVVGDNTGTVSAFSTSGSLAWAYRDTGAVTSAPAIAGGTVYVGAADGSLTALTEASGQPSWRYLTGSAIQATPSVGGGQLLVGSLNGVDTYLALSGTPLAQASTGAPVVGVGGAAGFFVTAGANGQLLGAKPSAGNFSAWVANAQAAIVGAPTVVNGEVLVTAQSGSIICYTAPDTPPA